MSRGRDRPDGHSGGFEGLVGALFLHDARDERRDGLQGGTGGGAGRALLRGLREGTAGGEQAQRQGRKAKREAGHIDGEEGPEVCCILRSRNGAVAPCAWSPREGGAVCPPADADRYRRGANGRPPYRHGRPRRALEDAFAFPPVITPKKSLGQNFLRDPNTVRRIADAVAAAPGQGVVEIGPGTGALTGELLQRYPHLIALEVDERAIAHLHETLPALDVRHLDVLKADWSALAAERGGPLAVVGNLPYYITSPILFALLDQRTHVAHAVVMMQREVAERLVALPRTKAYGILSVQFQRYCDVKLLFRVPPTVFFPRPNVESAVVRLTFRTDAPPVSPFEDHLRTVVRTAFGQRRKTLRNALSGYGAVPDAWAGKRAEELAPPDFEPLARALEPAPVGARRAGPARRRPGPPHRPRHAPGRRPEDRAKPGLTACPLAPRSVL